MDKTAFYRYAGRDVALRAHTNDLAEQINEKTANFDKTAVAEVNDQLGGLQYVDELQKIAESRGAARAYASVVNAVDQMEEPTAEKVASHAEEAFNSVAQGANPPQPETEKEAQTAQDEMVYGCAEALGSLTGQDPESDQILKTAVDLVANELEE